MTNKRYTHILLRAGVLASLAMAIFWGIWSHFAPVPDQSVLRITEHLTWTIPLSRWWDIPFMFALVHVYGWIVRGFWLRKKYYDFVFVLGLSFGFDFVAALVASLGAGLGAGLILGLVASLVFVLGLGFGLVIVLGLGFGLVIVALLKYPVSRGLWSRVGNWIAARDVK